MAAVAIRFVVRPINKLATAAKALQGGDLSKRVEVTTNNDVTTIDSLADHNAELQQELAFRRVAEQDLEKQAP